MCRRLAVLAILRSLRFVAISTLLAISATDQSSAQFQCPAGSRPVPGGGGIMCQCPDGSYAGLYTGCPQQLPQTQKSTVSVRCGSGYCPPGTRCGSGSKCLPANVIDCGNGQACNPGQKCSMGGGCVPQEMVDCGQGKFCKPGSICVGTKQCLDVWAECANIDVSRSIDGCTKFLAGDSESRSDRAQAFSNRGNSYREKGDYDRAVADHDQAIQLNPKEAGFYSNRGITLNSKGEYDRAIADFSQAIQLTPEQAGSHSYLARLYSNRGISLKSNGEHDRAIADFSQAIRLDPNNARYYTLRGTVYQEIAKAFPQRQDDLERAKADYSTSIGLPDGDDLANNQRIARENLAQILSTEGNGANRTATSVWNWIWATLSGHPNEDNILARMSAYLIEWVPLIERVPPYLRIAVLLAIALLLILYRGGYGQKSATAVSNAPSPQSDQQAPPSPFRTTPRTHHEARKEEEAKTRKPTENVSQRSPFDRGYR
jgi:tetratricopeptide (TPR) repeat protein